MVKKETWQMTREEFVTKGIAKDEAVKRNIGQTLNIPMARQHWASQHETLVKDAIREGKPVPAEVLKDYPDLKRQAEVEAKKQFEKKWQKAYGDRPETIDIKKPVTPEVTLATRDKFLQEQALTRNKALIDEEIKKAGNREVGMKVAADRLEKQVDTRTGVVNPENIKDVKLIREAITPAVAIPTPPVTPKPKAEKAQSEYKELMKPRLEAHDKEIKVVNDEFMAGEMTSREMEQKHKKIHAKTDAVAATMRRRVWGKYAETLPSRAELEKVQRMRSSRSQSSDLARKHSVVISPDNPKVADWLHDQGTADISGIDTPPISKRSSLGRKGTQRITPKTPKLRR